jgi:hypothetical protein
VSGQSVDPQPELTKKFLSVAERKLQDAEPLPANTALAHGTHAQVVALRLVAIQLEHAAVASAELESLASNLARSHRGRGACEDFLRSEYFSEDDFKQLWQVMPTGFEQTVLTNACSL